MVKIKTKLMGMILAGSLMASSIAPMTVNAQVEETEDSNQEVVVETTLISDEADDEDVEKSSSGPLTPEGNLTLVDDYGTEETSGKQFITLVSKSGNYFYLIIDRDKTGNETVHFLNLVDEADLLPLLSDEDQKAYEEAIEAKEAEVEAAEVTVDTPEVEVPEVKPKKNLSAYLVLMFLTGMGILGGYLYIQQKKKNKDSKKSDTDPDADYEEEEDYLDRIGVVTEVDVEVETDTKVDEEV